MLDYIRSKLLSSFKINETHIILRFGDITKTIDRLHVNEELEKLLWKFDKIAFILKKIGVYDELEQSYNWVMIALVNHFFIWNNCSYFEIRRSKNLASLCKFMYTPIS